MQPVTKWSLRPLLPAVPLLLILSGASLLWLLLQRPPAHYIDVGAAGDTHFIAGFAAPEQTERGESFRWANPRARIFPHGMDAGPLLLALRMNGDLRREMHDPQATLQRGEREAAAFVVAPGWRVYRVLLPEERAAPRLAPGSIFLAMAGLRRAGRTLTAPVDWIGLVPTVTTRMAPAATLTGVTLIALAVAALVLCWWRLDRYLFQDPAGEPRLWAGTGRKRVFFRGPAAPAGSSPAVSFQRDARAGRLVRVSVLAGGLMAGAILWVALAPTDFGWALPNTWLLLCGTVLAFGGAAVWTRVPAPAYPALRPARAPAIAALLVAVAAGSALRLLAATRGHNYDFSSFLIVADILERGGNVYAETERYNYGPVWLLILNLLRQIVTLWGGELPALRYAVAAFLTLVDIGIALVLWGRFGLRAACLVLLNPIAIIISGYHNQFDNLALLMGLLAVILFGEGGAEPLTARKWAALALLGLSLATKHGLFALPLWLALKQQGLGRRLAVLVIPPALFLASFAPFWPGGAAGIVEHVFLYDSRGNALLHRLLLPPLAQEVLPAVLLWLLLIVAGAFVLRGWPSLHLLLAYTGVLVAASPAIENQYLAIVVPLVAVHLNPWFALYSLIGSWHLLIDYNGLDLDQAGPLLNIGRDNYYTILALCLALGLLWLLRRPSLPHWAHLRQRREAHLETGTQA